jgi:tetratricopeptide (TPR) repeat protein
MVITDEVNSETIEIDGRPYNGLFTGLGVYVPVHQPTYQELSAQRERATERVAKRGAEEEERKSQAATLTNDDPQQSKQLHNVAWELLNDFSKSNEILRLDDAISFFQQAIDATPGPAPTRATYFDDLAHALSKRFTARGDLEDIEKAIQYRSDALDILTNLKRKDYAPGQTVLSDHPMYGVYMIRLANDFHKKYRAEHYAIDLENAVELLEQTFNLRGEQKLHLPVVYERLSALYKDQYARTGQMAKLDKALDYVRRAIGSEKESQPSFWQLNVLTEIWNEKFNGTGRRDYLDRAIHYGRKALKLGTNESRKKAALLSYLGVLFQKRSEKLSTRGDLDKGLEYTQQAILLTTNNSPGRSEYLYSLGFGYRYRFKIMGQPADLEKSTEAFQMVLTCLSASPYRCLQAKIGIFKNCITKETWGDAVDLLDGIMRGLPSVFPHSISRKDLQFRLRCLTGLASLSASIMLRTGKPPSTALEAMEIFRGIISSRMMDARFQHSELMEKHPVLWDTYSRLQTSASVDNARGSRFESTYGSNIESLVHYSSILQSRDNDINQVVRDIRQLPGFEDFLLPPTQEKICDLASEGPIVSLNASRISSEAFIITTTGIEVIQLPELRLEDLRNCIKMLASKGNAARRDAALCADDDEDDDEENISDLFTELETLWNHGVRLILQRLGLLSQQSKSHPLPRIWWVGTGITSLLPLHAAGKHTPGSTDNTLSHVISSYASSLKTLDFLRRKPPFAIQGHTAEVLLVSMPTSPGHPPLGVAREVEAIMTHTASWASTVCLDRPAKRRVLHALQSCTVAHFACHGCIDIHEPAKSSLIIGREAEERLTVQDLDEVSYTSSKVAYLSACSTAEISLRNMADESINVANNFQLAGFQHVIGTLWGADDDAAAQIASFFYPGLIIYKDDGNAAVAQALHDAVVQYRNLGDNAMQVSKWAPFIHLGC